MITKIAIASTLKPVIDPRAYEKIGKSLAKSGCYEVHIIGSLPTTTKKTSNVTLYPIAKTTGGLYRFLISWKVLNTLLKIRPEILIICTHELLIIGSLYKIFTGSKLIYDIQENYFFNLIYQKNYSWPIRNLIAYYVRLKEILLAGFVDYFLLAEQCYAEEIKFIKRRYRIVENKFIAPENQKKRQDKLATDFLISGTISKEYGVFEGLNFFKKLPASKSTLTLIGHCPNQQTFRALEEAVQGLENINFKVSKTPIAHQDILSEIDSNYIGLLPYQVNKSTQDKLPTKLYEYIGLGIPILISPNPLWDKIINKYSAGISMDFQSPLNTDEIERILTLSKGIQSTDLKDIMWNYEEIKLLGIIEGLIP